MAAEQPAGRLGPNSAPGICRIGARQAVPRFPVESAIRFTRRPRSRAARPIGGCTDHRGQDCPLEHAVGMHQQLDRPTGISFQL